MARCAAAAAIVAGLLLGGLALLWAGPSASAYTPSDMFRPPTTQEERAFRLKKYMMRTTPGQVGGTATTEAQAAANQKVVTSAARARLAGLGSLARGGLLGIAAGVWIHNGIMLYNVSDCGDPTCPDGRMIFLDAKLKQANGGEGFASSNTSSSATGAVVIEKINYTGGSSYTETRRYNFSASSGGNAGAHSVRISSSPCPTDGTLCGAFIGNPSGTYLNGSESKVETYGVPSGAFRVWLQSARRENGTVVYSTPKTVGPEITPGRSLTWTNPIYEVGEVAPNSDTSSSPSGTYHATPEESTAFYNEIKDQTCTPTAPAETTPEVCPDYFPQEWEEEFPDVNQPGEQDDPYGDPDKDGEPNHTDPDDDDDGTPDESDDEPYVMPPTAPNADPDEDGEPNRSDPDDDGDGIPDQDDPEPSTPTDPGTLPDDHPYADPDQDGQPNRSDPDDDGDNIPDEDDPEPSKPTPIPLLPPDHPYADPDEDDKPNREDDDDDGDGTPDVDDPEPLNPDVGRPDLDKDGIPDEGDGDQDDDGIPDWEDPGRRDRFVPMSPDVEPPDKDDDGVPDWSDPWPGNPYAPADPTKDKDLDKVPDYKDPEIDDPLVPMRPWAPGSPGDVPNNPGEPNIPENPTNPNHPPSSLTPAQPSDPTSPIDPSAPIDPNAPAEPGQPGGPPSEGDGCPVARESKFELPNIEVGSVLPFNLIIWSVEAVASLHSRPEAPVWNIPVLGEMDFASQVGMFNNVRMILTGFLMIGMIAGWYVLIKGSEA